MRIMERLQARLFTLRRERWGYSEVESTAEQFHWFLWVMGLNAMVELKWPDHTRITQKEGGAVAHLEDVLQPER